jgi:hypothetical protein
VQSVCESTCRRSVQPPSSRYKISRAHILTTWRTVQNYGNFQPIMKNAVLWDVTPCGFYKKRRFGGTHLLSHQGDKNQRARNKVCRDMCHIVFLRSTFRLLVTANAPSSTILVTLLMEALLSSETSVLIRATRR